MTVPAHRKYLLIRGNEIFHNGAHKSVLPRLYVKVDHYGGERGGGGIDLIHLSARILNRVSDPNRRTLVKAFIFFYQLFSSAPCPLFRGIFFFLSPRSAHEFFACLSQTKVQNYITRGRIIYLKIELVIEASDEEKE